MLKYANSDEIGPPLLYPIMVSVALIKRICPLLLYPIIVLL